MVGLAGSSSAPPGEALPPPRTQRRPRQLTMGVPQADSCERPPRPGVLLTADSAGDPGVKLGKFAAGVRLVGSKAGWWVVGWWAGSR